MLVSLSGQVVVIVGASSGTGRAAAVLFAREGAKVVAAARREGLVCEPPLQFAPLKG